MSDHEPKISAEEARELLRRERERIESSLAELGQLTAGEVAEIQLTPDPVEDSELIAEKQVDDAIVRQLRVELEEVEEAERRVEDGTYGLSVESGEAIPRGRLETVPWAKRTAEEQQRFERTRPGSA